MKTKIIILAGALLCVAATYEVKKQFEFPKAKVTARVVDEQGRPLAGAHVRYVFGSARDKNVIVKEEGITGDDGLFSGEGYCDGGYGASIVKEGYYTSGLGAPKLVDIVNGRWLPWNPLVTTVLRPIGNPIAMYVKHAWIEMPEADQPCGYDLTRGDWVAPYGTGEVPDLTFKLSRRYAGIRDYDVNVEVGFCNEGDGIQETQSPEVGRNSMFKWLREAPSDGYEPSLISRLSWKPNEKLNATANDKQMYFFRVRSRTQAGKLTSALYGKIQGGFSLSPLDTKTCKILLTYYLNPTSLDRNMEWEVGNNLFPRPPGPRHRISYWEPSAP